MPLRLPIKVLRSFGIGLLGLTLLPAASRAQEPTELWRVETDLVSAPEPLAADINLDHQFDIIQANATDTVFALDSSDGSELWRVSLGSDKKLLTPLAGNFTGEGRISVIVPVVTGYLYLLDGPTGQATAMTSGFLSVPPTLFPWGEVGSAVTEPRDGVLLYDNSSHQVSGNMITPRRTVEQIFSFDAGGLLQSFNPPVVGLTGLDAPAPHIACVTTDGRLSVFSAGTPGAIQKRLVTLQLNVSRGQKYDSGVTLADLDGDGKCELVAADTGGYLHAVRVVGDRLEPVWKDDAGQPTEIISILSKPFQTPIAIDVNRDGADDVLIPRERGFALIDGRTGKSAWAKAPDSPDEYNHSDRIVSPPAVFRRDSQDVLAVFQDTTGVAILNVKARQMIGHFKIGKIGTATPLVGPLSNGTSAEAFIRSETDGGNLMLNLNIAMAPDTPAWLAWRGGPTRVSAADRYYHDLLTQELARLSSRMDETMQQARALADQGDWKGALAALDQVLAGNPKHKDANGLRSVYFFRAHLVPILAASLVTLVILGVALVLSVRFGKAALQYKLARSAAAAGNNERAIRLVEGLVRRFPRRPRYATFLANLYIDTKKFDAQSAPVFEAAHALIPAERRYLKALAAAFSATRRNDARAAEVYQSMAQSTQKPGPWFLLLGQTLKQLDRPAEALEALRQVIVHQHEDPRLAGLMTDLYIQLEIVSPDILPTLDRVYDDRKADRTFLRLFCRTCQEARRYDERAREAALLLLEQDPSAPPAHLILATLLLQAGEYKAALMHAQQILHVNPNDSIGLRMLGACYAAENRLDETAMGIFSRALESNPDAPEILLAVSHAYIQEGRDDSEARNIFKKALAHSPNDETLLIQLATIAGRENDDTLTVQAVETLIGIGKRTRELVLQLANAYCRLNVTDDKAEPIYREALQHQPDHATIQDQLAKIFLRHCQIDAEAARVYEAVIERDPNRIDIGMQLIHCFQLAEMPAKAMELGAQLLKLDPDNAELMKLLASASEKADQMDGAIQSYEQVLAEHPDDKESICNLSRLYGRKRASDNRAIDIFNRAIQFEPQQPEHYISSARAYSQRGACDHSVQMLKSMLTANPSASARGIELMEELIQQHPKELALRLYLIDTQIFDGRLREARKHLTEALRLDPTSAPRVLEAFDRILERSPRDAATHMERGRLLLGMNRDRDARQALEQAHRYHPENDETTRLLMKLYQKMLDQRDSTEVRFQLGKLAIRVDKFDLAIQCFQATGKDYRWEGQSVRNLARCFMAKGMLDLALQELKRLPLEDDVKEQLYELGQRYESVNDIHGAREVYKLIFAADITFRDVKGKLETLHEGGDSLSAERTAIINSLSEEAKQRYELIQELGRGAMGIVYKARDSELDEVVALKILPDSLSRNLEAVRRFKQEARSARRLSHPNIVRIHDIGEELGRRYISMEFVEGTDLKQKLRATGRKIPFERTLAYARQIAEAMAYAHSTGVVHRDIKPANLMLDKNDNVKVTDFGIAKIVENTDTDRDKTAVGAVIGTPLYMSPEQVKGLAVDHRADIYSTGVVFYELANGHPPFVEGDLSYQHLFGTPKPLANVPSIFNDVVMKCLAKTPEERWQSMGEVAEELKKITLS